MTTPARPADAGAPTGAPVAVVDAPPAPAAPLPGTPVALVHVPQASTAHHALVQFDEERMQLLADTIMPGANQAELDLFALVCRRRGLDPFAKQIHPVKRRVKEGARWIDKWSFQTAIDGFRLIAERTGKYRGQTTPLFCGEDGVWTEVWLSEQPPRAAKVGVLRVDFDQPVYVVALWREYVQTKDEYEDGPEGSRKTGKTVPVAMWLKIPTVMLAKVAEALALRKAFPEELSGMYTDDEMAQADSDDRQQQARAASQTQAGTTAQGATGTKASAKVTNAPDDTVDPEAPIKGANGGAAWTAPAGAPLFPYGPLQGTPLNAKYNEGQQRAKKKGGEVVDVGGQYVVADVRLGEAIDWALSKLDKHIAAKEQQQGSSQDNLLKPENVAFLEMMITNCGTEKKLRETPATPAAAAAPDAEAAAPFPSSSSTPGQE